MTSLSENQSKVDLTIQNSTIYNNSTPDQLEGKLFKVGSRDEKLEDAICTKALRLQLQTALTELDGKPFKPVAYQALSKKEFASKKSLAFL